MVPIAIVAPLGMLAPQVLFAILILKAHATTPAASSITTTLLATLITRCIRPFVAAVIVTLKGKRVTTRCYTPYGVDYCGTDISIIGSSSGIPPSDTAQRENPLKCATTSDRCTSASEVNSASSSALSCSVSPLGSFRN